MPSLIVKKEEKTAAVFDALKDNSTEEAFIAKFKEMYPKDWNKVQAKYAEEERKTKSGKTHPMPHPDVYMRNMYKVAVNKRKSLKHSINGPMERRVKQTDHQKDGRVR